MTIWPEVWSDEFCRRWAEREARIGQRARELFKGQYPNLYWWGTGYCTEERLYLSKARTEIEEQEGTLK